MEVCLVLRLNIMRKNNTAMYVNIQNRMIVDHSFKLGYLFCITISDLKEIVSSLKSSKYDQIEEGKIIDLAKRFIFIEKHFRKLHFYNSISDDDLKHVIPFLEESKAILNEAASELSKNSKLTTEKVGSIEKLLKDMMDY